LTGAVAAIGFLQSKVERALALFGRRPPQRVESIVIPASENLHRNGRWPALELQVAGDRNRTYVTVVTSRSSARG
jgi:hypothetical protein